MKTSILQGSVFDVLPTLEAGSVDCCVTSPPYWQLRSYLPKDHALKPLELGSEKTPAEFVQNMVRVFQEVRRVLAEHGTCFVNIGDTYASGASGMNDVDASFGKTRQKLAPGYKREPAPGFPAGNLCLIPQRLAIALQDDGWIIRSVIVWHKPAPMPSSVSGWAWRRCRVKVKAGWDKEHPHPSHNMEAGRAATCFARGREASSPLAEWSDCTGCPKCTPQDGYVLRRGSWRPTSSWEPILMLAKSDRYFCDGEAVKQPMAETSVGRYAYSFGGDKNEHLLETDNQTAVVGEREPTNGANLRDVWTIAAEPLKAQHYAAYPSELVYRCLKAGTSARGYCPECGAPWARVVDESYYKHRGESITGNRDGGPGERGWDGFPCLSKRTETLAWRPSCSHISEPRAGVVLDPFSGSGRTGLEARRLGLDYVGIELNPAYVEMSQRILRDDAPLFV